MCWTFQFCVSKSEKVVTNLTSGWHGKDRDNFYQKIFKEKISVLVIP